jgi:hypothetical protein
MPLYQHLIQCSAALQLLLNRSAYYWCLVPMDIEDLQKSQGQEEDQETDNVTSQNWSPRERTKQEVEWCLANVPKTPDGTRFSRLQLQQQKMFFKNGSDLLSLPPRHLDIFNMTIVFVCMYGNYFNHHTRSISFFFSTRKLFTIIMSSD